MLHVREEIPSKPIQPACREPDTEHFLVEINLRRNKCLFKLLVCNYSPHKTLVRDCASMIIFCYYGILTQNLLKKL